MRGLGPSIMKFWTCGSSPQCGPEMPERGSKASTLSVVWANFGIFFGAIQMTSCRDCWSWTKLAYVTITRRQSNYHPTPKNSECKNPLGSRRHPPHWLPYKGPNYQRGVLLISAGAIEGHFEGKTPREFHQRSLVLARQRPGSPGTCNPEETGLPGFPVSWSPTLFSESRLKGRHFSSDTEVIAVAETWLDGQLSEFWVVCKS